MDLAYFGDLIGTRKCFPTPLLTDQYINAVPIDVALWMDTFELFLIDLRLVSMKASFNVAVECSKVQHGYFAL